MTHMASSNSTSNRLPDWPTHLRYMASHIKDLALLLDNIIDQTRSGAYTADRLIVVAEDIASAINEIANSMIMRVAREEECAK